jgi:hypothetical protein
MYLGHFSHELDLDIRLGAHWHWHCRGDKTVAVNVRALQLTVACTATVLLSVRNGLHRDSVCVYALLLRIRAMQKATLGTYSSQ